MHPPRQHFLKVYLPSRKSGSEGSYSCSIFSSVEFDDDILKINEEDPEENKRHVNGKVCLYEISFYCFLFVFVVAFSTLVPYYKQNFFFMCI